MELKYLSVCGLLVLFSILACHAELIGELVIVDILSPCFMSHFRGSLGRHVLSRVLLLIFTYGILFVICPVLFVLDVHRKSTQTTERIRRRKERRWNGDNVERIRDVMICLFFLTNTVEIDGFSGSDCWFSGYPRTIWQHSLTQNTIHFPELIACYFVQRKNSRHVPGEHEL